MRRSLEITLWRLGAALVLVAQLACGARAQSAPPPAPGNIVGGSRDTMVGGKSAARQGDAAGGSPIIDGSPDVFINGKPAALAGSSAACGAVAAAGAPNVFVNGKPLARTGDAIAKCAK
jgi:uncharacterized Zn-binding protein involved in type VI secretion